MLPVDPALHNTMLGVRVRVSAGGWVIFTVAVVKQPAASFTDTVYTWAVKPLNNPVALVVPPGDTV
jgi:hypothetical protein